MTARAKWMGLFLLIATWAGIAWMVIGSNEPQHVPLKFVSGQPGTQGVVRGSGTSGSRVDLALLLANRQSADDSFMAPKNIFRPLKAERETPAPSAPAKKRELRRQDPVPATPVDPPTPDTPEPATTLPPPPVAAVPPVGPPVVQGPTPEELAKQAGQKELSQYRYLGYLVRGGRDEAFLSKGKDLHIVKAGETIDQRVLVKTIAPNGVTLQETASRVEHTVVLAP